MRESLLILIRELATKGTVANDMLDDLTIVIAPQVNPDGFENDPRSTRGNSWGLDLNRDYMKLEQAAIGNLVTNMYQRWHPHLIVDGHNGGARPYNIIRGRAGREGRWTGAAAECLPRPLRANLLL